MRVRGEADREDREADRSRRRRGRGRAARRRRGSADAAAGRGRSSRTVQSEPDRAEVEEAQASDRPERARPRAACRAEQRVGHVAAVELADGHQVEGGHEEAEPGGQAERADDAASCPAGARPRRSAVAHWKSSGSPRESTPRRRGSRRHDAGLDDAQHQHGQADRESRQRARRCRCRRARGGGGSGRGCG